MSDVIGVTGASGRLGRRVVEHLLERVPADRIRALTRHGERLEDLARRGVTVVRGDFNDPEELTRSLEGVARLLMISTDDLRPGVRMVQHRNAVQAARRAGVRHVAYTSALDAARNPVSFMRDHAETEVIIRDSGLRFTFLRNNLYAESLLTSAPQAVQTGVLRLPAGEGRVSFVAREDCARLAAAVLTTPGHEERIYEVTGPESLSYAEVAAVLSELSGRAVRYEPVSLEEYTRSMQAAGLAPAAVEAFASLYRAIAQGFFDRVSPAVREVTGQEPLPLREALLPYRAQLRPSG
ncbi:MAG: SDR family oxidoreductase [Armatimonadota bacterium]|nr:SDR family oxidoreductase [Armatimonadota bacterium]MDR7440334.1 SDR family oxidoreductase [Armatimonadota bacterium]MDR7562290.1 SDR family oxidoreductase [Armatimonadota bacterium]MDR7568275.1 SDR family oxidoreductase [Armatimonadota bacterium]MDR7602535.1 SDR family oxidoreductase [Armatimonadota bacterium]